jgi:MoaA/NifB/PqqE/SkfB family radical SAM enzyme
VDGIRRARVRGFRASLIFTVSRANIDELEAMGALACGLGVERVFIQVLGLRGQAAGSTGADPATQRVTGPEWRARVPAAARAIAARGVHVVYPRVFLDPDQPFECAGRVADNYFVFPNGRVYRCPLCEDYPVHSLELRGDRLEERPGLNERDLFRLNVVEGCVMNALIQPFGPERVGCCLLKQDVLPG